MDNHAKRIEQLEIRLAFQEDLLTALNDIVSDMQQKMDLQQEQLRLLWQQIQEQNRASGKASSLFDEIPPHY